MTKSQVAPIRIVVADDPPVVRDGLVAILGTQPDFAVIGEAATGDDVLRGVAALGPDVLLLDLELPEMDGVEALRVLRGQGSVVRVLVFTAFDTDDRILAALRAGAQGYLLKGAPREELFQAIRVVHAGGSLLQPVVASRLLRQMGEAAGADGMTAPGIQPLTPRRRRTHVIECWRSRHKTRARREGRPAMPRFIACSKNQGNPFDGQLRACRRRRDVLGRR